jgi:plasmid stability protein
MSLREQQTARVNVDDATWQAFRIRAIQAEHSVADELGRLVRNDLRRSTPREGVSAAGTKAPAVEAPARPKPSPPRKLTPHEPRGRPKQRLADLDLLTGLPYRPEPSSRPAEAWEEDPPNP